MSFSQDDLIKFKSLYIETARKYLEEMQQHSIVIKQGKNDKEEIHAILIAAHSLGGQSHAAGYEQIARLCSLIQEICIKKEETATQLDENLLFQIEKGVQKMLESVEKIEKGEEELDLSEEIGSLEVKG